MNLVKKTHPSKGADLIVRKTLRFIARRLVGYEKRRGNVARHKWSGLAHDEIGAFEMSLSILEGIVNGT